MKCPGCKYGNLIQQNLLNQPKAYVCRECHGKWIQSTDYRIWLKKLPQQVAIDSMESVMAIVDSSGPKICPTCQRIMLRYRIGKGMSFRLDQCGHCGNFWLDAGKWEALELQNLQTQLHAIVSPSWQWKMRQSQHQDFVEEVYADRLQADHKTVQQFQKWLSHHPQQSTILAYLNSSPCHDAEVSDSNGKRSRVIKKTISIRKG